MPTKSDNLKFELANAIANPASYPKTNRVTYETAKGWFPGSTDYFFTFRTINDLSNFDLTAITFSATNSVIVSNGG